MKIVRSVPIGHAFTVAAKILIEEMSEQMREVSGIEGHAALVRSFPLKQWLDKVSDRRHALYVGSLIPGDTINARENRVEALLNDAPTEDAAVRAWCAEVEANLSLARADDVRPYDWWAPHASHAMMGSLHDLADALRDASSLLTPVAAVVERQAGALRIGEVAGIRAAIATDGVNTGSDDDFELVSWREIEALMPGFKTTLLTTLDTIDAGFPIDVADDDQYAARLHTASSPLTATAVPESQDCEGGS